MRSDLFDHIMVWIYNSEIRFQMDIMMNILLTYSTPVVYYVINPLPGLIVTYLIYFLTDYMANKPK